MTNTSDTDGHAETRTEAFDLVCAMGDDLQAARDYINVIARLDEETFQDAESACAVQQVNRALRGHIDEIEDLRGILFRLLHPRRAEFEKTGWPDDAESPEPDDKAA
jgi:hypothetical protein